MCIWTHSLKILLCGSIRQAGTTLRPPPTRPNFLAWFSLPWIKWFGKLGRHQRLNSSLGWLSKTEFGPRIDYKNVDGQIVVFAPSASESKKVDRIFSSNAASLLGYGTWSLQNLGFIIWTPLCGILRVRLRNGGQIGPAPESPTGRPWPL